MIRQKVILGNYRFIVDLYKAGEDLVNPTYRTFYLFRDVDLISGTICDRHIYFINKEIYDKKHVIYPINDTTSVGYTKDPKNFNANFNENNLDASIYHLYRKNINEFEEAEILCDMVRIYYPTIKNDIDAIIDIENFINDVKYHYLIADMHDYERHARTDFTIDHQTYSEFIDIYIPSLNSLLYDDSIFVNEYNTCLRYDGEREQEVNEFVDGKSVVPFNTLYYPYEILTERNANNKPTYKKRFITTANYINNQFYSTLNLIMYPYVDIDSFGSFIIDSELNANGTTFNMPIETSFKTEIRFPLPSDFVSYSYEENISNEHDYEWYRSQPLTFEILEDGFIYIAVQQYVAGLYYSVNNSEYKNMYVGFRNGVNTGVAALMGVYGSFSSDYQEFFANKNDIVKFIGDGGQQLHNGHAGYEGGIIGIDDAYNRFVSTCKFNVYGNILSLAYFTEDVSNVTSNTEHHSWQQSGFAKLFIRNNIISAKNLILENSVTDNDNGKWIYYDAYEYLFEDCTELIEAPIIYDTTLSYKYIFKGCSKLNKVICLDKTPTLERYEGWLDGVSPTGTLYKDPSVDASVFRNIIPEGWIIKNYIASENNQSSNLIRVEHYNTEEYNKYYGVPCAISKFNISGETGDTLIERYLKLNGLTEDSYIHYNPDDESMIDYKDEDDEYFGEDLWEIKKTGFYIEMATDKRFTNIFFKYKVNINSLDSLIDDFTFPLTGIFNDWEDVPSMIVYRITFIDKVACNKIQSNPVVITDEWYKYIVNNVTKAKLHLNKVYKIINKDTDNEKMIVGNYNDSENPILFIDKINCSIIKDSSDTDDIEVIKKNAPKIIYKPVFYRTTELQNITIKSGVTQNIGINLDEYMTKVETFKLIIGQNEYIEYGRNNIFVIFRINAAKLTENSGKYIITNEDNDYISDGTYTIN